MKSLLLRWLLPLCVVGVFAIGYVQGEGGNDEQLLFGKIEQPLVSTTVKGFAAEDRRDRRPKLSEDEYVRLAAYLREVYSQEVGKWPRGMVDERVEYVEMGALPETPYPEDNLPSDEKLKLGKQLFFDGRLSGPGQMSCASCHIADLGWADGRARSLGHGAMQLARNTPTMLNSAHNEKQFWDGRAESLEALVVAVLTNPDEMSNSVEEVVAAVEAIEGYRAGFATVFGNEDVTIDRIAKAIATYVRSIVSEPSSQFDKFLAGRKGALSDSAVRGLHLFRTDARCMNCHSGPLLTDQGFHSLGLVYYGRKYEDLGRYNVTGNVEDVGKFKTPSLRNVARTAPYTHVGFFDLTGMLNMYNAGMVDIKRKKRQEDDPLFPVKDPLLKPLHLNDQDLADLKAFLESLTERRRRDMMPTLPK